MIEMQWVKTTGNEQAFIHLMDANFPSVGIPFKLQFREVTRDPFLKFETATEWQDVKIGEST